MSKSKHFKSPYLKTSIAASKPTSHAVNQAYEIYLNSLAVGGRKGVVSVLGLACKIMEWDKGAGYFPWEKLTYQLMHQVRARMLELDYSKNSVNMTLAAMRGLSRSAFNLELIGADQLMRIQAVQAVKGEVLRKGRSLSDADIRALLKACSIDKTKTMAARDKALLLVGYCTGSRCSELITLRVGDVDFVEGKINILNCKGRKQRSIALAKPAIDALHGWIAMLPEKDGYLFREIRKGGSVRSNGLTKQGVTKILQRLQQDSKVKKFSPHDLRRSFVTKLISQGHDINVVKTLCNHASILTTEKYDYRNLDELKVATRAIF